MRSKLALLLAFVAGLLVAQAPTLRLPLAHAAPPPGSTTTFDSLTAGDRAFLSNNREVIAEFALYERRRASLVAGAAVMEARRDAVAARSRAGLVAHRAMLEDALPAALTNVAIVYEDDVADGGDGDGEWDEDETEELRINGDVPGTSPDGKSLYP